MKKILCFMIAAFIMVSLAGCSSLEYKSGTEKELHPGHVGHEVHGE